MPAGEIRSAFADHPLETELVARFDRLLTNLVARRPPEPAQFLALDSVLHTRPDDVVTFAEAVDVSPRTLQRLCLQLYGFAPKRLIRRQRFVDTLGKFRAAVSEPLETAIDPAYFDQAHFYRDFRDFMGMSPSAYFTASRDLMARAARAQEAAGVTLSFKLPPTPQPRDHRAAQHSSQPLAARRA